MFIDFFLFLGMACFWGLDFLFNDFAHMGPWEDGPPNFPFHPHNSKEIPKQKLLVKVPGAHLPGACWKILRIMGNYPLIGAYYRKPMGFHKSL